MSAAGPQAMRIVQIAPEIAPGSGVAGVAYELERALTAAGAHTERFTRADAGGRSRTAPRSRLGHVWDVVWFSTTGTRRARAFLAARPDAVSICHNDALVGDLYVNHGLLQAAMRARGHYFWRMVRNPLHLFTAARDRKRYRGDYHRTIIALTQREAALLTETYGEVRPPIEVIPNGVDIDRFRPPAVEERETSRRQLGLDGPEPVAVFIGHEFDRKGLPIALDALVRTPRVHLLVVGGTPEMIERARATTARLGLSDRVTFAGLLPDAAPALWASDVLVLPSAYEANALVVLEALACGIPVVSTPVGAAPDLVVDGVNGYLIERDAAALAERLEAIRDAPTGSLRDACRATAEEYSWTRIAARYLETVSRLQSSSPTAQAPGDGAGR
ncbi:UDP-glucose:(heptosyl)LPS alpha-1,3-glucosyltransferase [Microbacterium sp. cf046]|uniref:glycosyltransferase family 4 protein n=1 Tax=Microbacterium sp. cf046 TaxID=1761803 RepID=UPI0008F1EAB0|nr:glycosyltransferase family 4 protein [Microbacterium sp. cf046]SFR91010.1 UDP-glucose:(heptosyl)LPS alpha-1,3-glucosyltransferase [Microbacterium sp. cf046]